MLSACYPADTPELPRSEAFHHPVDAAGQRGDVVGFDGGEHRDPQLVAAEFAVGLGVDDAVSAQHLRYRGRIDVVGEIDRPDQSSPPLPSIQSSCSASRMSVPIDGVL